MSFNLRKKSPIEAYRNFVTCGVPACKKSCISNRVFCVVCLKWYHYKCLKLKESFYSEILDKHLSFVCSIECSNSLFPFSNLNQIDFLTTLVEDPKESFPCKKCKKECLDNQLMNCIQCEMCCNWLHAECANLNDIFENYIDSSYSFFM